mmetsp:Transcript_63181/g.142488  ORF Transcript_63181/g.142488 Transcript_63181/m.142488 type:complete len:209 (+) Transcript_63181:154-780(+)
MLRATKNRAFTFSLFNFGAKPSAEQIAEATYYREMMRQLKSLRKDSFAPALALEASGEDSESQGGEKTQWTEHWDDAGGYAYWYNEATGESTYEDPTSGGQSGGKEWGGGQGAYGTEQQQPAAAAAAAYPQLGHEVGGWEKQGAAAWGASQDQGQGQGKAEQQWCSQCNEVNPARQCDGGCARAFCVDCFMEVHKNDPSKKSHTFHNI